MHVFGGSSLIAEAQKQQRQVEIVKPVAWIELQPTTALVNIVTQHVRAGLADIAIWWVHVLGPYIKLGLGFRYRSRIDLQPSGEQSLADHCRELVVGGRALQLLEMQ